LFANKCGIWHNFNVAFGAFLLWHLANKQNIYCALDPIGKFSSALAPIVQLLFVFVRVGFPTLLYIKRRKPTKNLPKTYHYGRYMW